MNKTVLECVARAVYRRCSSCEWWPYRSLSKWVSEVAGCVDDDLFDYEYVGVISKSGAVLVVGIDSLAEAAKLRGECLFFKVAEIEEVFRYER